ncbi:tRNA(Met) cytidine acetyltransferase TmcA [archaeon HR06]|nr:tRNA(Met) cytidine acetyltransferase TmcA [archaeon HR06]
MLYDIRPNHLGLLVELVRGGGLVILVGPSYSELDSWLTEFHKEIVTPPFNLNELSKRFEKRFLKNTIGREGTLYLDFNVEMVKGFEPPLPSNREVTETAGNLFPIPLYNLCVTNEQRMVLKILESLIQKRRWALVIKANRGRGKTALLGLASVALLTSRSRFGKFKDILVTSPEPENIQPLFDFAIRGLKALGKVPEIIKRENLIWELRLGNRRVFYRRTLAALEAKANIALVDEAAGIPIPLLLGYRKRFWRAVYSSTIHGYEGAGRGFSVRFLRRLREEFKEDLVEVEMKEPIRYSLGDPVEAWLYDVLLLDAEPAQLEEEEKKVNLEDCKYLSLDRDKLFLEDEERLRQIIGLYVLTHYRNTPDDLILIGDAPHHSIKAIISPQGKVIGALHLCYEGESLEAIEKLPKGHMIPSIILRYYPHLKAFGNLRGLRIVRIAVHPELWRKGIGSWALKKLREEERKLDWIGSGFGSSPELLRFWLKNDFYPIAVGPRRNRVSGEFSVVVVHPLSRKAEELVVEISKEFRLRFLESLHDSYFDMDKETAWLLLSKTFGKVKVEPKFSGSQRLRLESYLKGQVIYEGASDSIKALTKAHFLTTKEDRLNLDEKREKLLILKVLQGRKWESVSRLLDDKPSNLINLMKETIEKMAEYYI